MEVIKNKTVKFESDSFIWRYIDLHKLLSFLFDKTLFFTRLDHFNDPLEGLTEKIIGDLTINAGIPSDEKSLNPTFTSNEKKDILKGREYREQGIIRDTEKYQKTQFANCWFVGKKESFAMWNIYSDYDSVAIRYNPQELLDIVIPSAESFNNSDFKKMIYGYVDYDNIWPFDPYRKSKPEIKHTAFKKDLSYEHENEFRFVVLTSPEKINNHEKFELPLGDISKDNFKIFANPYMNLWKYKNLERLLNIFSLQDKLEKSRLKVNK